MSNSYSLERVHALNLFTTVVLTISTETIPVGWHTIHKCTIEVDKQCMTWKQLDDGL